MTIEELLAECQRKQAVSGRKNVGVYLTLPYRKVGPSDRIKAFGRFGPLGEVLNVTLDGRLVAVFPADRLIQTLTVPPDRPRDADQVAQAEQERDAEPPNEAN